MEPTFGVICPVEDGVIDPAVGREVLRGGGLVGFALSS